MLVTLVFSLTGVGCDRVRAPSGAGVAPQTGRAGSPATASGPGDVDTPTVAATDSTETVTRDSAQTVEFAIPAVVGGTQFAVLHSQRMRRCRRGRGWARLGAYDTAIHKTSTRSSPALSASLRARGWRSPPRSPWSRSTRAARSSRTCLGGRYDETSVLSVLTVALPTLVRGDTPTTPAAPVTSDSGDGDRDASAGHYEGQGAFSLGGDGDFGDVRMRQFNLRMTMTSWTRSVMPS